MVKGNLLKRDIGVLLRKVREKSNLSQFEVTKRIGLSSKSGQGYISRLEKGKVKNPPLHTILEYLRACGASWVEFFKELDRIDFKMRHEKMILQLPQPPESRKVERAAMRYETGIEFPSKEKEEIDFNRLKSQIENKVTRFLSKQEIENNQATLCHKFVREYFHFMATLNKPGMKAVTERYQRAGLKIHILYGLKKIINSVIRAEIKRIEAKKPLPAKKQEKMVIEFTKYRIKIEKIEAAVHKVLCDLAVQPTWFTLYKDFARECYRTLKRYYSKDSLEQKINDVIRRWVKEGLKEAVLLKVKEATIKILEGK